MMPATTFRAASLASNVCPLIVRISGMAFDPMPFDVVAFHRFNELLPEISIFDRLFRRSPPAVFLPVEYPFGDPVLHIGAVD